MIILNGNIAYFNLSGVLRFLYSNKLTGILHLQKKDRSVDVFILNGKTMGVEPTQKDPIEQLVEVSIWVNGEFSFELTVAEKITQNLTVPHDQLTLLIAKKEKEYREIKRLLPPLNAVLVMGPAGQGEEIRLHPGEWNLLSKVDGKRTLEEIVHTVDLDELSSLSMIVRMIQKGILSVVVSGEGDEKEETGKEGFLPSSPLKKGTKEAEGVVPKEKVMELEKIFMRYVGPMGTFILDEILENMKLNRDKLPVNIFSDLIRKMEAEIDSEEDKHQFNDEALGLLG